LADSPREPGWSPVPRGNGTPWLLRIVTATGHSPAGERDMFSNSQGDDSDVEL